MQPSWHLRRFASPISIGASVAAVILIIIGFFPGFGGPGYPATIAAGLVLPIVAAICGALRCLRDVRCRTHQPLTALLLSCLVDGFVLVGVCLVVMLAHGLRSGFCDPVVDLVLFFLGPGVGTLVGALWGFVLAHVVFACHGLFRPNGLVGHWALSHWRWATFAVIAAVVLGSLATVMASLWRFYTSPMVFAYNPFLGFFSGTLYDTEVTDQMSRLLTYRAASLCTMLCVTCLSAALVRNPSGRLGLMRGAHPALFPVGLAWGAVSCVSVMAGSQLGHWQTSATIARVLGGRIENSTCEVIYPRRLDRRAAELLLRDCTAQARQVAKYLNIASPAPVRVFVFQDRQQKRMLTGAGGTSVAKPWRGEVYVQLSSYPHPILAHEVAHIYAGTFARGPFRIAGSVGGWLPDPGLIEGIAEAAAPDDDLLTSQQWCAAMRELQVLPPLSEVFALGFLSHNSSTAYTAAGAFVDWVAKTYGIDAVKRWYGGASLRQTTGKDLPELEAVWLETLSRFDISPSAMAVAKARFDRPGVLRRRCPYAVDRLNREGFALAAGGDCAGALDPLERSSRLDPSHPRTRLALASCVAPTHGFDASVQAWQRLAGDESLPEPVRQRAQHALGDSAMQSGDFARAYAIYDALIQTSFDIDELRTLDIKRWCARHPEQSAGVRELLVGTANQGPWQPLAFSQLGGDLRAMPQSDAGALAAYLIGRNLVQDQRWHQAFAYLDHALETNRLLPSVAREALRLRIIATCATGGNPTEHPSWDRWLINPSLMPNQWRILYHRLGDCLPQP